MIGYLRLEVLRSLRDPRYMILALVAPVGFYLLFAGLYGQQVGAGGLSTQVALMVSLSVFGIMWAVMLATGPRIAQDRSIGWQRQLQLLPMPARSILAARLLAAVALALPALVLMLLTAVVTHGVSLDAGKWVTLALLLWLASVPFAVLGIAIGYAMNGESAFGLLYGLNLVLGALGGLWFPVSVFPTGLQNVGKLLPSFRAADLGWHVVAGRALDFSSVLILVAWTAAFCLLAFFFSSRVPRTR
jgi:ABC-2 type transport system permease protein